MWRTVRAKVGGRDVNGLLPHQPGAVHYSYFRVGAVEADPRLSEDRTPRYQPGAVGLPNPGLFARGHTVGMVGQRTRAVTTWAGLLVLAAMIADGRGD